MKSWLLLILISLVLSSCTDFYFSKPQPIGVDNTYSVPDKYIGLWRLESSDSDRESSIDSIFITKNYYKRISRSETKESKSVMESDSNIYFLNNKVYTKESGDLEGGYHYIIKDDTVIVDVVDIELIEFGENAFLRKIDYGYILNLKHEKMEDWWNIKFIDTRSKEGIIIKNLRKEDLAKNKDYKILHDDFDNYLIANWSKEYVQGFINKGGFSDTTMFLKYNERIKNQVK